MYCIYTYYIFVSLKPIFYLHTSKIFQASTLEKLAEKEKRAEEVRAKKASLMEEGGNNGGEEAVDEETPQES